MTTNSETIKQCLSSINLVKLAPRHHDLAPRHQDRVCENNWAFLVSEPVTKHYTVTRAIIIIQNARLRIETPLAHKFHHFSATRLQW